jgi:hypothetical protein
MERQQLKQLVVLRCLLKPLELDDCETRLVSGWNSRRRIRMWLRFPPSEAIQAVLRFSRGIPRLIYTICQNTLIAGYSCQAKQTLFGGSPVLYPGIGRLEEVLGLLAQMIEERDDSSKKSSRDFKTETGAKTI